MCIKSSNDPAPVRFAILADLQYAPLAPMKNRYFTQGKTKLKEAIEGINRLKPDFVINLGDTIDRDYRNFREILPLFQTIIAPVYHVLGNHDYEVADEDKVHVPSTLGISNYYHFSITQWRFIVLDGNEISTFANVVGSSKYQQAEQLLREMEATGNINGNFWNGGIGKGQLQWLDDTLNTAQKNDEQVIIFCHYPIFPPDRHNLLNADEVMKIIAEYPCTKAWFCGHNHHGNYGMCSDIHFVNVRGMVEGECDNAWSIVSLEKNRMSIEGHGNEISARLEINSL